MYKCFPLQFINPCVTFYLSDQVLIGIRFQRKGQKHQNTVSLTRNEWVPMVLGWRGGSGAAGDPWLSILVDLPPSASVCFCLRWLLDVQSLEPHFRHQEERKKKKCSLVPQPLPSSFVICCIPLARIESHATPCFKTIFILCLHETN